jgi:hypothetical protein
MHTYRFYFYDDHTIRGRFDFQADDDDRAVEAAEILFEACSDRSQSWEIWDGDMLILSGPQILEKPTAGCGFEHAEAAEHYRVRGSHSEQRMGDSFQQASPCGTQQIKGERKGRAP